MLNTSYLELPPAKELKPLIKCFWISANHSGSELYFTTLPDGCVELVVLYQEKVLKEILVSNVLSDPYDMVMPAGELKMGIRLTPLGKEYYLDRCPELNRFAEFSNTQTGNLLTDLQRFSELVTADMQNVIPANGIDRRKEAVFDRLQESSGNIDVEELSKQCGWSARQINRYFNKLLGMPLKAYSNILKCYAAYDEIKAGHLYPDLGYYDQSHFIREVRKHTDTNPKTLLKNKGQRYLQFNKPVNSADQ
ncbi:DUF6597 domain-containing transcriptional factor [Arcticibacter sp. MXS-1]|uniref:DUF6597 domain-containing transcriptional factor n=1 Tax=Arcticibacter sp. MXS-1 TaxID=3341726 RepID=UPI0035A87752